VAGLRPGGRLRPAAIVALLAATIAAFVCPKGADAEAPWKAAEQVRATLFEAQSALLLDDGAGAALGPASRALDGQLSRDLGRVAPLELRTLRSALAAARAAFAAGDETALAAARGRAVAALRRGAFALTVSAVERGDVRAARSWLLVRDFRAATRFTRPGVDATVALDGLAAGEIEPADAVTQVRKDLLDAYQARLGDYLDEAEQELDRGFGPAAAESGALVRGYWQILAPEYEAQRGAAEREATDRDFAALEAAALAGDEREFARFREAVTEDFDGFTAAPFTPEEEARRAAQLTRFLDLVPIEYDDGTEEGQVTIPFELQEAVAFMDGASDALGDLEGTLDEVDPTAVDEVDALFAELRGYAAQAQEGGEVVALEEVEAAHAAASEILDRIFPQEWKESNDEADFDLIDISLDQMEAAVSASEREQAEQARLSAYAFFEFGPEIKLRAFDPALVTKVEGLMWYGAEGVDGLAELISGDRPVSEIRETRLVLDEALDEARAKTGEGASKTTVITNAAMIVFREGLEAILIIAAITASMIGARRGLRRPILRGALLALPASVVLWFIAQLVLDEFSQYGEKLEAVVGLIAIGVLLLVLNWFFHRVYWTEWIAGHRQRGKALTADVGVSAAAGAATVAGLYMLGFSSVFREGFETVLFLQALQLSSGTGAVLAGVSLGLVATAAVGALTFALERRLPYKRMLIVTGVLIALVLVVLVGNTVRTLQGVGWLSITPLDVEFPLWMGTWLGVFPTVETLVAQLGALAFVVGSYFAAEWYRKRRVRRAARELADREPDEPETSDEPDAPEPEPERERELATGVTRSRT
jgi:high-affinity iron transporter